MKSSPRRTKRTRDPDSKLAALHAAALDQFTTRGYEQVSIAQIAKQAGIAVGTVYRFYENKLSLLRAMLEGVEGAFVSRMAADWETGGEFADRLDRICEGVFDVARERSAMLRLFTMTTDVVYADGTAPGGRIQEQIRAMYQEAADAGAFRGGDAEMMAALTHGMVEGALMRWMHLGSPDQTSAPQDLAAVMKHGILA
ncbi:MAG: TetR/AcrR family transcriptional regulator [Pseudomonadota bacterium]